MVLLNILHRLDEHHLVNGLLAGKSEILDHFVEFLVVLLVTRVTHYVLHRQLKPADGQVWVLGEVLIFTVLTLILIEDKLKCVLI